MLRYQLLISILLISTNLVFAQNPWEKTGGPIGGLGYNVKVHPTDKNIMFVTDAFTGVNKSVNGGELWATSNTGIDVLQGPTGDAIPIFSLTIDPYNNNIVWAGTQGNRGVFKSVDGGASFVRKEGGITEDDGLTVRNFKVTKTGSTTTVYMSCELNVGVQGDEFSEVKGQLYKSDDGGDTWVKIWEGGSLARWLEVIPEQRESVADPQRLVLATGIFDREAFNVDGEGMLVSEDGGANWVNSNTGISNSLFIGGLDSSPSAPNTLLIATGNNNDSSKGISGGVYKSTDAGASWSIKLGQSNGDQTADKFTAIQYSPSDANIVYAANEFSVYRSNDGGETWNEQTPDSFNWGPPGVRAGFPIEMTIDADNPDIVFINNYGGGVFKSTDAGVSWIPFSTGYTGAQMTHVSVSGQDHFKTASIGRSGPYISENGGETWEGISFGAAVFPENYTLVFNPTNDDELLLADQHQGKIVMSTDNGMSWQEVYSHPDIPEPQNQTVLERHGAKELTYAPSDPSVVYAGFAYQGFYGGPQVSESNSTIPAGGSGYDGYVGEFENSYGIVKSTQGGAVDSWVTMNNGLGGKLNVSQIRVDSEDPNKVIISLRSGGVFKSTDGATNWTEITNNLPERNIRSLDISKQDSDVIYAGTRFYGIYKSVNGGTSWVQVLAPPMTVAQHEVNSLFGAVAVHPTNADIVMVADWWSGIYITLDGGSSWDLYNNDLSTRIVRDIEFSSDGKFVYAGTTGEGVFRMQFSSEALVETSETALDFGTIKITESGEANFNMNNYGNVTLNITGFNFSGSGISVPNQPSSIAAGTNTDISLSFSPSDEINYDQTLTVQTDIGNFVIDLTGTGEYLVCSDDLTISGEASICGPGVVTLDAGAGFDTYQWFKEGTAIDGATSQTYDSDASGSFTVRAVNTGACAKLSAAHVFTINELPGTQISVNGATLTAPSGESYQWSRDGNPISGETSRTTRAVEAGVYTVEVTSDAGCVAISEPVTATPILESGAASKNLALVYPNPSNGIFELHFSNPSSVPHNVSLVDSSGKLYWSKEKIKENYVLINLPNLAEGIYLINLNSTDTNQTVRIFIQKD